MWLSPNVACSPRGMNSIELTQKGDNFFPSSLIGNISEMVWTSCVPSVSNPRSARNRRTTASHWNESFWAARSTAKRSKGQAVKFRPIIEKYFRNDGKPSFNDWTWVSSRIGRVTSTFFLDRRDKSIMVTTGTPVLVWIDISISRNFLMLSSCNLIDLDGCVMSLSDTTVTNALKASMLVATSPDWHCLTCESNRAAGKTNVSSGASCTTE